MCDVAFSECEHVYIAGDDDQAIYEWNGADVGYFLSITGERVILDKSYRMPSNVLNFSKNITSRIKHRVDKVFAPRAEGGKVEIITSLENFDFKKDESYYLLARNNYYLKNYEELLRRKGQMYSNKEGSSVNNGTVQVINAHEYHREDRSTRVMLTSYVYHRPTKKKELIDAPWYEALDIEELDMEYYRDLIANKTDLGSNKIKVSTVHGVKGGEADNVVMLMDMTRRTHAGYDDNTDSELRCLYVGCTRAKKNLYIVPTTTRYGYDEDIPIAKLVDMINKGELK